MLIILTFIYFIINIISNCLTQTILFISPEPCNENSPCDGLTYQTALDSIMIALVNYNNTNEPLTLLLIPNPNIEHYLLGGEIRSNGSIYYNYTNDSIILDGSSYTQLGYSNKGIVINIPNLTISPLFCSDFPTINYPYCIHNKSQMIKINIKTSFIIIQIQELNLQNIILDGNEDIYMLNTINLDTEQHLIMNLKSNANIDNCIYTRMKCCMDSSDSLSFGYYCTRNDISYRKILEIFNSNNGLFLFSSANEQNPKVTLTISNCIISNLWLPYRNSIFTITSIFIININNTTFTGNLLQKSNIDFTLSCGGDFTLLQSSYSNYMNKFNNESTLFSLDTNSFIRYENVKPGYTTNIQLADVNLITSNLFSVFICLTYKNVLLLVNYTTIQMNNIQLLSLDNQLFGIRSMTDNNYDFSIYIDDAYSLEVSNMTIYNIIKPIEISNILQTKFSKCNFTLNYGKLGDGLNILTSILVIPQYMIDLQDSLFESNIAEQGGGLSYIGTGYPSLLTITNVIFTNNKATKLLGGAIAIQMSDTYMASMLKIQNITCVNNYGAIGAAIFIKYFYLNVGSSLFKTFNIILNNSTFKSNYAYFISPTKYDFILDTSLLLSELPSKYTGIGGAIYLICLGLCNTSITNNIFNSNYAELAGGGLYSSEALIQSNSFVYNALDEEIKTLLIKSSSDFAYGSGGAIYTSLFQANRTPLSLKECLFIENKAIQVGGAIQGNLLDIKNTIFKNNSANRGGALYGSDYHITDCEFLANKAINDPEYPVQYPGKGGAIFLQKEILLNQSHITTSIFHKNTATVSGGAIYITSNPPFIDLTTVKFLSNSANIYGPDLAAFPISMIFLDSTTTQDVNYDIDYDFSSIISQNMYQVLNLESGSISKALSIGLLDIYGQIVTEDDSSQIIMQPINKDPNVQLVINPYSVTALNGKYVYHIGSQIIYKPGLKLDILMVSNAIILSPWKERQFILNISFRACEPGEIYQDTTCYKCPGGYYSLEANPYYQGACQICNQNAICFGGNQIYPKSGYWRMNNTADLIIPCPNTNACLGSSTNQIYATISGNCSDGYEGNLCGSCSNGFTMLGDTYQCYNCKNTWYYYVIVILVFLIKIMIFAYSIHSSIKSNASKMGINQRKLEIRKTILMKILVNYGQLMTFAENFQIIMPNFAIDTVSGPSKISFNFSTILSLDCYLNNEFSKFKINRFYLKVLIAITLPMTLILMCAFTIFLPYKHMSKISCIKKCSTWLLNKRDYLFTALLVFLVYFHQEVLQAGFTFFFDIFFLGILKSLKIKFSLKKRSSQVLIICLVYT